MSQSGWYHVKAAECNRLALASTDAVTRDRYIKDRDNWRDIAARIDVAEEAIKQRKEKKRKEKKRKEKKRKEKKTISKVVSVGGLFIFKPLASGMSAIG